jgi:hypothetical protein
VAWATSTLGIESILHRMPTDLSHGQRKLVSVGRAMAQRPRLVLLDEPAAGLDSDESLAFGDQLRAFPAAGVSALLVDHDMGLVLSVCDRVIVLLPRIPEWQISMVACLKAGAIPIPCIEMLTAKDIAFRVRDSGAAVARQLARGDRVPRAVAVARGADVERGGDRDRRPDIRKARDQRPELCRNLRGGDRPLLAWLQDHATRPK